MLLRENFRPLLLAALLCPAVFTMAAAPSDRESGASRAELYYGLAKGNYLVGDIGGAKSALAETLRIDPENLPALALRARILIDEEAPEKALIITADLTGDAPGNMEYRLLHALTLARLDRKDEALSLIGSVIQDAPQGSSHRRTAHQMIGLLRMSERDWEAAAAAFRRTYAGTESGTGAGRALESEAYAEAAAEHEARGAETEAITAYGKALELSGGDSGGDLKRRHRLLIARARVLAREGRIEDAIRDLQAVTGQNPDQLEAVTMLASLYAAAERWLALDELLPVIRSRPGLEDIALYLEGRSAFAKDRIGTARARFEEAGELLAGSGHPLLPSLVFYRGACLLRLDRKTEGDEDILRALEDGFQPENGNEALLAGTTLIRADRPEEAVRLLEPAALRSPDSTVRLWNTLGRAHQATGKDALALSALNKGVDIDPTDAETRALRAGLLRSMNDLEGAAADYEAALTIDPDNPAYAYALGLVRFQQGILPSAEERLSEAAAMLRDRPGVQLLHALLAFSIERTESARKSLQRYHKALPAAASPNESALLLAYCVDYTKDPASALSRFNETLEAGNIPDDSGLRLYRDYFNGAIEAGTLLNLAGRAETPDAAARKICEAAFWMAQYDRLSGEEEKASSHLQVIIELGNPDLPEYIIALWQLR